MIFDDLAELCKDLRGYRITHYIDEIPTLAIWPDGHIELIDQHFEDNSIPAGRFEGHALYFDFPQVRCLPIWLRNSARFLTRVNGSVSDATTQTIFWRSHGSNRQYTY